MPLRDLRVLLGQKRDDMVEQYYGAAGGAQRPDRSVVKATAGFRFC
jgi:hypothetical protein